MRALETVQTFLKLTVQHREPARVAAGLVRPMTVVARDAHDLHPEPVARRMATPTYPLAPSYPLPAASEIGFMSPNSVSSDAARCLATSSTCRYSLAWRTPALVISGLPAPDILHDSMLAGRNTSRRRRTALCRHALPALLSTARRDSALSGNTYMTVKPRPASAPPRGTATAKAQAAPEDCDRPPRCGAMAGATRPMASRDDSLQAPPRTSRD